MYNQCQKYDSVSGEKDIGIWQQRLNFSVQSMKYKFKKLTLCK